MLPLLFLFFLFFLLCSVDVATSFPAHADLSNCTQTFDCGPLRNLTYPFTGGTRPSYCGPPEFHLTCVDNSAELTIGQLSYRILKLDPAHQNMTVARSDLWNYTCTDKLANSTLESEFFSNDEDDDMVVTIFYGCNSTFINPKPQNWFLCDLNFPFKDAYYLIGPVPLDPIVSKFKCSVGITVPILKTTAAVLVGNRSLFKEAIMAGFNVNYTNPYEKQCAECLNVNGLCGFDSDKNRPVCICGKRLCDPAESLMIIIVGALGSVAFCSLVVVVAGCFFRKRLRTVKERYHSKRQKKKVGNDMKKTVESLQFRLGTIETATNKFSDDNKLGEGGFGAVFKGTLGNGHEIAVKRLSKSSTQGVQEFQNEVVLVAKLQHRNLVRLQGFCLEGEETLLVYEYVPNKSLDKFLFEPKKREQLDWPTRCMIIGGIARGILYLHEDSRLRVIHRDLKASNILLDDKMNPKISDFGMAKMFGIDGQTQGNTKRVVGTPGYMAPEYAIEGIYSVKSDVFSFGILLLEITTGRKNFLGFDCRFPTLLAHAWQSWNEGKGLDLIDPILLKDSCRPDQVLRYIHIGLLCVQEDANIRPTMSSVVLMLKTETISLSKPERPAFFTGRSANMQDQIAANSCTINGFTISDDLPR